jgi:hypothetical protein
MKMARMHMSNKSSFKDWAITYIVPLGLLFLTMLVLTMPFILGGIACVNCVRSEQKSQETMNKVANITVINHDKVYEGVVVEGPTYLANQQIAVVGVEIEVDGHKVIKPAMIPIYDQHTWNNLVHGKELKLKVKIKGADIQAKGEHPFFFWVVQQ